MHSPLFVRFRVILQPVWTILLLYKSACKKLHVYKPMRLSNRGLQCFKLNGNQTENDRYWQKITFYFLQNVWKCTAFFAFAFKVCKKCYYDPKKFFLKNINMVIKTRRILFWFQIRWCRLKQMPLKKARAKKQCEFWVFSFLCIFSWFFAFIFCKGHFWKPASTNLKSAFFWYPYWYFSRKICFGSL